MTAVLKNFVGGRGMECGHAERFLGTDVAQAVKFSRVRQSVIGVVIKAQLGR